MIKAEIKWNSGYGELFINGRKTIPQAYMTYICDKAEYADFSDAGITLYSLPVFFASQTIQELAGLPPFEKGHFDGDTPDFSPMDFRARQILSVNPDAYILPRLNMSLSRKWELENPDELCDITLSGNRRPCFSSDKWAEETKRQLRLLIEHVQNSDYAERVIGYQLSGGNTEEWFPFDMHGSEGLRSRQKFAEYCEESGNELSDSLYFRFLSQIVADRICEFAEYAKKLTDGRLLIGSFYGYTFEVPDKYLCHHALKRVLECEYIDVLSAPVSYSTGRDKSGDHPYMLPISSLALHKKLYFSENDTRTHLSRPFCDLPRYTLPIWFGPEYEITCEIMKMHAARALVNKHGFWWFDMWGGWYSHPGYMELIKKIKRLGGELPDSSKPYFNQVALFVDEKNYSEIPDGDGRGGAVCSGIRRALGVMGLPYDTYLLSDLDSVRDKYKLCVIADPLKKRSAKDAHNLIITPENAGITPEELRNTCRAAGAFVYCNTDAVIYASDRLVFVKPSQDLPPDLLNAAVFPTDLFTDREISVLKKDHSYLFLRKNG